MQHLTRAEREHFEERLRQRRDRMSRDMEQMQTESSRTPGGAAVERQGDDGTAGEREDDQRQLLAREDDVLQQVQDALRRIADGSFGRCAECGRPIERARLDVVPYAGRCVRCEGDAG